MKRNNKKPNTIQNEVKAHLRYFRVAPRKTRLVVKMAKGLPVNAAVKQLLFAQKRSASALLKLLKSAVANAKTNSKLDPEKLYVKEFKVDEAPILKRFMPRARGRASMIRKRRSHITLILSEREQPKTKKHK